MQSAEYALLDALYAQTATSVTRTYIGATGRLQSETRDGVATSYTYTSGGDIDTMTNGRGVVTKFGDYKRGIAGKEVHAYGTSDAVTVYREVNDLGCVTSFTDGEGHRTVYGRDALCRLISITYPKSGSTGATITYTPYSASNAETQTFARGDYTEVLTYDGFGRVKSKTAAGVRTTYEYDALGRKSFESYPFNPNVTGSPAGRRFEYDGLDRLIKVTHTADGSNITYTYTVSGTGAPQTDIKNERGNVVNHVFRAFGSPEGVVHK